MLAEDAENACFKIVEEKLSELQAIKVARNALRSDEFAYYNFLSFCQSNIIVLFML